MRVVAARRGWMWFALGWSLFKRSPLGWIVLVFSYWLLIALINEIPFAGAIISTLLLPAFSVSFMGACVDIEQGVRPSVAMLLSGFRNRLMTLLVLGGLYFMSILAVLGIASLADGGTLFRWIAQGLPPPESAIADGSVMRALLLASAVGAPGLMAFWFSPVLTAWRDMGAAQSMFYSFFASLRNWRAFAVYGLVIAAGGLAMSLLITIIAVVTRGNAGLVRGAMLGLSIGMLPTIFATFYYSYRDIFGNDDGTTAESVINGNSSPPVPPAPSSGS